MNADLPALFDEARKIALRSRSSYDAFFSELEQAVADFGGKVSGDTAAALLLEQERSLATYQYEIYVGGGRTTAQKIAARLYRATVNNSIVLNTEIKETEFTITMDGKNLVKIHSQPTHHGTNPVDMIKGVERNGYFADVTIETLPEEIILINYCRILYNPAQYALWPDSYDYLTRMWDAIRSQFFSKVTGGVPSPASRPDEISVALPGEIIIGDEALVRMGLLPRRNRHMQIITAAEVSDIAEIVSKNIKRPTHFVSHSISLPGDFELKKNTIYAVVGEGKQRPVLEVFNSTAYEIVGVDEPCSRSASRNRRLGSPWTILRFLFLDLWLMKLVKASKKARGETAGLDRIDDIISGIARSAETLMNKVRDMDPEKLFPADIESYDGVNINERVMRKKYRPKSSMWFPAKQ